MIYRTKPENFKHDFEAVGCFLEYEEESLFLHRQDHKTEGNKWGHLAGRVKDSDASLRAAAKRETYEESGLEIEEEKLVYWGEMYVEYPKFKFIYHVFHYSLNHLPERPQIRINREEHKDHIWKTPRASFDLDLMLDEEECIRIVFGLAD